MFKAGYTPTNVIKNKGGYMNTSDKLFFLDITSYLAAGVSKKYISPEEYQSCQDVWICEGMHTFEEYVRY